MHKAQQLKQQASLWLYDNRGGLPLNSRAWAPLFVPPQGAAQSRLIHLGKYDAAIPACDFFYKPISKIR